MRFNGRLRACVRGLPFKCKATKLAMGGDLLLPGEISQFTGLRSPNFVQRDNEAHLLLQIGDQADVMGSIAFLMKQYSLLPKPSKISAGRACGFALSMEIASLPLFTEGRKPLSHGW